MSDFAVSTFMLAIAIGPLLSSRLQEHSGGEYTTSFVMLIIVAFAALIVSCLLSRAAHKEGIE
jgi:predicted MFS family arabinose efflux permease